MREQIWETSGYLGKQKYHKKDLKIGILVV